MRNINDAKREYESIPVPGELSDRIEKEIRKADKKRNIVVFMHSFRKSAAAAAAVAVLFTAGLNTSVSFASAAGQLPVIGEIARVLTFRSYETETEDLKLSVEIPDIDMISADFKGVEKEINEEIHKICEACAEESRERAKEYRQAFLDTGGTEEEWEDHDLQVKIWYEVKTQTDRYLSLAVMGTENWNNAGTWEQYYNIDLESGKEVTLEDILGENYVSIAEKEILAQMERREREEGISFFKDSLPEIGESTAFYMNEEDIPVIVFQPYEIAPGAMGSQAFEIQPVPEEG